MIGAVGRGEDGVEGDRKGSVGDGRIGLFTGLEYLRMYPSAAFL